MRRWLAKLLCPDVFKEAESGFYLRRRLDELDQWCGYGFPEIKAAVDWVRRSERVWSMSPEEYDAVVAKARDTGDFSATMVGTIDRFREEISDHFDRRPERAA